MLTCSKIGKNYAAKNAYFWLKKALKLKMNLCFKTKIFATTCFQILFCSSTCNKQFVFNSIFAKQAKSDRQVSSFPSGSSGTSAVTGCSSLAMFYYLSCIPQVSELAGTSIYCDVSEHLGPILFLLYIYDMPDSTSWHCGTPI